MNKTDDKFAIIFNVILLFSNKLNFLFFKTIIQFLYIPNYLNNFKKIYLFFSVLY
jgi:hypothetical protein